MALFLPQLLSDFSGIHYANERVTTNLLIGGGLISAANVLILIDAARQPSKPFLEKKVL